MLSDLHAHTGPDAEQEDDITMVVLQRSPGAGHMLNGAVPADVLAEFEVPSAEGNERLAIARVSAAVGRARPRRRAASSASRPRSARRR